MSYLEKALRVAGYETDTGNDTGLREDLGVAFKQALREIQDRYVPGLLEHVANEHPDIDRRITLAEETLERNWVETLEGLKTATQFNLALRDWKVIILSTCNEHRTEQFRTRDKSDRRETGA